MQGKGGLYFSEENYFYKGDFKEGKMHGRGVFFYPDSKNFYLGEVKDGKWHGKGLFYTHDSETGSWELNDYEHGVPVRNLNKGEGKP